MAVPTSATPPKGGPKGPKGPSEEDQKKELVKVFSNFQKNIGNVERLFAEAGSSAKPTGKAFKRLEKALDVLGETLSKAAWSAKTNPLLAKRMDKAISSKEQAIVKAQTRIDAGYAAQMAEQKRAAAAMAAEQRAKKDWAKFSKTRKDVFSNWEDVNKKTGEGIERFDKQKEEKFLNERSQMFARHNKVQSDLGKALAKDELSREDKFKSEQESIFKKHEQRNKALGQSKIKFEKQQQKELEDIEEKNVAAKRDAFSAFNQSTNGSKRFSPGGLWQADAKGFKWPKQPQSMWQRIKGFFTGGGGGGAEEEEEGAAGGRGRKSMYGLHRGPILRAASMTADALGLGEAAAPLLGAAGAGFIGYEAVKHIWNWADAKANETLGFHQPVGTIGGMMGMTPEQAAKSISGTGSYAMTHNMYKLGFTDINDLASTVQAFGGGKQAGSAAAAAALMGSSSKYGQFATKQEYATTYGQMARMGMGGPNADYHDVAMMMQKSMDKVANKGGMPIQYYENFNNSLQSFKDLGLAPGAGDIDKFAMSGINSVLPSLRDTSGQTALMQQMGGLGMNILQNPLGNALINKGIADKFKGKGGMTPTWKEVTKAYPQLATTFNSKFGKQFDEDRSMGGFNLARELTAAGANPYDFMPDLLMRGAKGTADADPIKLAMALGINDPKALQAWYAKNGMTNTSDFIGPLKPGETIGGAADKDLADAFGLKELGGLRDAAGASTRALTDWDKAIEPTVHSLNNLKDAVDGVVQAYNEGNLFGYLAGVLPNPGAPMTGAAVGPYGSYVPPPPPPVSTKNKKGKSGS
jgi:hypothetical protein